MNLNDLKKELLADPNVKAEYDRLGSQYEIINELIKLRKEQGITQKELARRTGLKQSAVSRLETGNYNPSLAFLERIAQGIGKELHIEFR
ncbi:transcriptional regulator [Pasteurellaceae bacterium Orientalotternb1]|nr:transcriptional regulator [Pasteurellaceae bacterium Orientalotternb1]